MVEVADDVGRIEQHQQVLGQVPQGIDLQFAVAQIDGTRFSHTEHCAGNPEIDVFEALRRCQTGDFAVAADLGRGGADDLGLRVVLRHPGIQIRVGLELGQLAAHALHVFFKARQRRSLALVEARHVGQGYG